MRLYCLLLMVMFFSCDNSNTVFLGKFTDTADILKTKDGYTKLVKNEDLVILQECLIVNSFVVNSNQKFYYGFKKKLNSKYYLITYCVKYIPLYKPTFNLWNWHDDFLCLYDVDNNKIVSKLKIHSSDPVVSRTKLEKDIYIVKSLYRRYKYNEVEDKAFFEIDSLINKYKIENNKFIELK